MRVLWMELIYGNEISSLSNKVESWRSIFVTEADSDLF